MRDQKKTFDSSDTVVLAVSIDPPDVQRAFARRWELPFALIPDTGRNLCFLYNAVSSIDALADRVTFVIDKEGVVKAIDRNVNIYSHGTDIVQTMHDLKMISEN